MSLMRTWMTAMGVVGLLIGSASQFPFQDAAPMPASGHATAEAVPAGFLGHHFEPNLGQADPQYRFLGTGGGVPAGFAEDRVAFAGGAVQMTFPGAGKATLALSEPLPGRSNYYLGADPTGWVTNVPHAARVTYVGLWPGIDLVFYGAADGALEYDWLLAPGADPSRILVSFDGATPRLDGADLVLATPGGEIRQHAPVADQAGARVAAEFALHDSGVGIALGGYDPAQPLRVDPIITSSTYLGGSAGADSIEGVGLDAAGNVYVVGQTQSSDFPTENAIQPTWGGDLDVFFAKFDASGRTLLYATYLGGTEGDIPRSNLAVDAAGNAVAGGGTNSPDFPTQNALKSSMTDPFGEGWVARLDPTGALAYSTFLGRAVLGVAADSAGVAHVTGWVVSEDLPTMGGFQDFFAGAVDSFIVRLTPVGEQVYGTYLGGAGADHAWDIAVDAEGNDYVAGQTSSDDFPTAGDCGQHARAGSLDAFLSKVSADGSGFVYSTYIGGSLSDRGFGVAADAAGHAYVVGVTNSANFPVKNALYGTHTGLSQEGFVAVFDPDGMPTAATYIGGLSSLAQGVTTDSAGAAYVFGWTNSAAFPTRDAVQAASGGQRDAFLAKLGGGGTELLFATYLGGSNVDAADAVATDSAGGIYVAGGTDSIDFPTRDAFQATTFGGDAFLTVIRPCPSPQTTATFDGIPGNAGWWRSPVTASFVVESPCPIAATFSSLDGGGFAPGATREVQADGVHTLAFYSATTTSETETAHTVPVAIDATPPAVAITRPVSGNAYLLDEDDPLVPPLPVTAAVGTLTVRADASDALSGVQRVEFRVDGHVRAVDDAAPYGFAWITGEEGAGEHELDAVAFDAAGNSAVAASVRVTTAPTTGEGVGRTVDALPLP